MGDGVVSGGGVIGGGREVGKSVVEEQEFCGGVVVGGCVCRVRGGEWAGS